MALDFSFADQEQLDFSISNDRQPPDQELEDLAVQPVSTDSSEPFSFGREPLAPTTSRLFGSGIDVGQALVFRGIESFAQFAGAQEIEGKARLRAEINEELSGLVVPETFVDKLIQGAGTVAVGAVSIKGA